MSDGGGMSGRRDDDLSVPLIAQRLEALEQRVDAGFAHLERRLDTLGFVRSDVYAERNAGLRKELDDMKDDITDAAKPGKWALALFGSTLFVAIVGVILQVAFQVGGG